MLEIKVNGMVYVFTKNEFDLLHYLDQMADEVYEEKDQPSNE